VNSAASLAADLPVGRIARYTFVIAAYVIFAILAWIPIGLILNVYQLRSFSLVPLVAYCAYYGIIESTGLPGLAPPGSKWQVPQSLVAGTSPRRRILIWGGILGPGFFTRNPYAGFGLLPLAISLLDSTQEGVLLAAVIGTAHGGGRALALVRDARVADATDSYLRSVLRSVYWQVFDGMMLLTLGSMAVTIFALSLFTPSRRRLGSACLRVAGIS
jgi:hypothetical protein